MSREIKFRAWDKKTSGWYGIDMGYADDRHGPISIPVVYNGQGEVVIMQYTGLKDNNGVEIYEGDIVIANDGWGNESTHRVEWGDRYGDKPENYPAFDLYPSLDEELNSLAYAFESGDIQLDIIGNIYENPELLGDIA